jgi:threonine dehydrogenase-like Zn-dependent dehydrogenase
MGEVVSGMKAVVFLDRDEVGVRDVPDPSIRASTDAIVRVTISGVCGIDLQVVHGRECAHLGVDAGGYSDRGMAAMRPGTVLGHEGVGVVEAVGEDVRNFRPGDRVVIPSTIACGVCSYCRAGYHAHCDRAKPNGPWAGTAFYGGPRSSGGFDGTHAGFVRVPYAATSLIALPDAVNDQDAILLSDIFPAGWFAARLAEVRPRDTVAVLGAGPVGLFAVLSALRQGATRVIIVDRTGSRLDAAQRLHAEPVDCAIEDPVEVVRDLTGGAGVDRVIDTEAVDAPGPDPARMPAAWWAVDLIADAGTISVIGLPPATITGWPIEATTKALARNFTVNTGSCHHRRYIPQLLELVAAGLVRPAAVISRSSGVHHADHAYHDDNWQEQGWTSMTLEAV